MSERTERLLSQDELESRCRYWQSLLGLLDWDVKAKIARGNGLDIPEGQQGRCNWTLGRKEAFVRVLDHIDWDPAIIFPQDMEATLVHELLHLHLAPFAAKEDSPEDTAQEQMIKALSYSLVSLARGR